MIERGCKNCKYHLNAIKSPGGCLYCDRQNNFYQFVPKLNKRG